MTGNLVVHHTFAAVEPATKITVDPPRDAPGRSFVRVPWIVNLGDRQISLHINDTATLRRFRDVIDAAIAANPGVES